MKLFKPSSILSLSLVLAFTGSSYAQSIQPWSGYAMHDMKRPAPVKVASKAHVSVAPPADADIIFDGKNTDQLTKAWKIVDDYMQATKAGSNKTKKSYGDCQIHIEWRVPNGVSVKGQHGGNSGVYIMDRYEIQIQETHTNVTYPDGQAGAIYGQTPPLVNASRPQGEWQSYDIFFTAPVYTAGKLATPAYVTVIHNGIVIHNHQQLYGPATHGKPTSYPKTHPAKAPIGLQWHGDLVEFKNFWVRDLSTIKPSVKAPATPAPAKK